jgi:molybdopterin synthase sulfur carrier subunit
MCRGPIALETLPDMSPRETASAPDETNREAVRVTLRYWAAAKAAAGRAEDEVAATTVAGALDEARRAHVDNPRFAQVLGVSSLLLGEQPLGSKDPETVQLRDGDVIEVLPPFAGG